MKSYILGILTVVVLAAVGYGFYQMGFSSSKKQDASIQKISNNQNTQQTENKTKPTQTLVGNDKDEHGCIGSAGYSWCESKNKCLRVFEEGCPSANDEKEIRQALIDKNKWSSDLEFTVDMNTNDGKYASGSVASQGGGGYFYAQKENGKWVIVADGNGMIMCSSMEKYPDYPNTLISECWDEKTQLTIKR